MNIAVVDPLSLVPSARTLMERALEPHVLLGMPHLTPHGLSETWLMKELGHRHWLMLALRFGMDNADFRTLDGREAYASICASSLHEHGDGLRFPKANHVLEIGSSLSILAKSRHCSRHEVACNGRPLCEVELVSTFVSRERDGDNHSLTRIEQTTTRPQHAGTSGLAGAASAMRKSASARQALSTESVSHTAHAVFSPDLQQDFNGAGLLYFATFQSFFSRAIVQSIGAQAGCRHREIFFFGNIRPGENITVSLPVVSDDGFSRQDMVREDGKIIATSRTCR